MHFSRDLKNTVGWDTTNRKREMVFTKGHSGKGKSHHPRRTETSVNFVGVDGEGCTGKDGQHRYVLFGVGDKQIENPDGLQWKEIFEFLYAQYRPNTAYVGFYLGYDFSQIFKTLPEGRARMLLTSEGIAKRKHRIPGKQPHPVECAGWQFDILANKRLRIRPKGCECPNATCKCKHDPWMYVCDVGSFFQSSFLSVINPEGWAPGTEVVTGAEYALIEQGKTRRSVATLDDSMRMYNLLENEVLVRVMKTLDRGFHDIGIHLPASKWFGPGQAAQAWMEKRGIPKRVDHEGVVPDWFLEAARMSYFGGWFEPFVHGIIPGTSHEYDINSAYPWVISQLPCLLHGEYSYGEGLPTVEKKDLCLVYGEVWSPGMPDRNRSQHIGAMLHRDVHGSILRPLATAGWYWWDEITAAQRAGLVKRLDNRGKQRITKWVKYHPCDCPPPMGEVSDLYMKRLEYGKKSPRGKAAKLVYNSKYGKNAQSIGNPMFGNPVYASRITSQCRTCILDAIGSHPDGMKAVCMIATDAVYFLTKHPTLTLSENLGDWEYSAKERLSIFKPGVYWDEKTRERIARGESPHFKARGFQADDFVKQIGEADAIFEGWGGNGETSPGAFPVVTFTPGFTMVTALQALRRGDWGLAGSVTDKSNARPLTQNADPILKRDGVYRDVFDGRVIWRSRPHWGLDEGGAFVRSHPYEKRFGMEDPFSEEYKTQWGETPDGTVLDVLAWILGGE